MLLPGQISYLKKQSECDEGDLLKVDLEDGCFDHLILILSIDTQNAQVEALIVSLFHKLRIHILRVTGSEKSSSLHLLGGRLSKKDIRTIAASGSLIYQ